VDNQEPGTVPALSSFPYVHVRGMIFLQVSALPGSAPGTVIDSQACRSERKKPKSFVPQSFGFLRLE